MAANDSFFGEAKQAQSALKHSILKNYLATFAGATGTRSPGHRVGFIDGYAGPGEYVGDGGVHREGSPKIALTIARNQLTSDRHLECIFVEKKPKHFESLDAVVREFSTPAIALKGDVKDHLQSALSQLKDLPVLVFLDPFGASLDRTFTIDAILNRGGEQPTELLLNFSVQTVRRAGSRIREPEGATGREATLETMDNWLGGDWWRPFFLDKTLHGDPNATDVAANRVATEYARRITEGTNCGVFGVEMRRSAGHKPLFILMLFHPRALAAFKYNEAVSLGQEQWRDTMWGLDILQAEKEDQEAPRQGMSRAAETRDAFKADKAQFKLDAIAMIKSNLRETLRVQPSVSVEKEFRKVFGKAAGLGRTLHLRAAWAELNAEGVTGPVAIGRLDKATISRTNGALTTTFI